MKLSLCFFAVINSHNEHIQSFCISTLMNLNLVEYYKRRDSALLVLF